MAELTYYQVLGLSEGATTSEIKARYRKLAKRYHPDCRGNTQLMAQINTAYTALADPRQRYRYDQELKRTSVRHTTPSHEPRPTRSQPPSGVVDNNRDSTQWFSWWKLWAVGSSIMLAAIIVLSLTPHGSMHYSKHVSAAKVSNSATKAGTKAVVGVQPVSTASGQQTDQAKSQMEKAELWVSQYEKRVGQDIHQFQHDHKWAQNPKGVNDRIVTSAFSATMTPTSAPLPRPFALPHSFGVLQGTYYYKVAFVTLNGTESNLGPASVGVTLNHQAALLSHIPISPDSSVSDRIIYRTKANAKASGTYYYLTSIHNNSTTSYLDDTPDNSLVSVAY